MLKIGILVSGGGTNLQCIIEAVESGKIPAEIACVVSSKKDAYAIKRAEKHGIEIVIMRKSDYTAEKEYEYALIDFFNMRGVGLILTAGFSIILADVFVKEFENRLMNVHPSLIPSFSGKGYYGLKVHEAALEKGVKITGATVHFVNTICDGGPIILQKTVSVLENDTAEILQKRVMKEAEWVIYPEAVRLFALGKLSVKNNIVKILT